MIQRDRDSTAVVFEVRDQYMHRTTVDLDDNFNNIARECRERNLKLGIRVVIRNENNLVLVKNSDVLETIRVLKMRNPNLAKIVEYNDNLIYGEYHANRK